MTKEECPYCNYELPHNKETAKEQFAEHLKSHGIDKEDYESIAMQRAKDITIDILNLLNIREEIRGEVQKVYIRELSQLILNGVKPR